MTMYRKLPVEIEAEQWFKHSKKLESFSESDIVVQYKGTNKEKNETCSVCEEPFKSHGWIKTLEGGHIVCFGDWIIRGIHGEFYPCKPDIFSKTYEKVD